MHEDALDEHFLADSLQQERQWIDKFKNKQSVLSKRDSNKSSEYSFSTEYSSELEEVYEQFSRWLHNPILETEKGTKKELEGRELAVVQFAGSLLKRTLSESFAGVPVPMADEGDEERGDNAERTNKKSKLVLSAKSLSLELARHKHKLAAQLVSKINVKVRISVSKLAVGSSLVINSQLNPRNAKQLLFNVNSDKLGYSM